MSRWLQWLTRCCEIAVVFFVGCMREDNENGTLHTQLVSAGRFHLVCSKFSFYDGGGGGVSSECFLRVLHLQWKGVIWTLAQRNTLSKCSEDTPPPQIINEELWASACSEDPPPPNCKWRTLSTCTLRRPPTPCHRGRTLSILTTFHPSLILYHIWTSVCIKVATSWRLMTLRVTKPRKSTSSVWPSGNFRICWRIFHPNHAHLCSFEMIEWHNVIWQHKNTLYWFEAKLENKQVSRITTFRETVFSLVSNLIWNDPI